MKLYLVEQYGGEWDDSWKQPDSIWESDELASLRVKEIKYNIEKAINAPSPYPEGDYEDDHLSIEESEEYEKWLSEKSQAEDFVDCIIKEFELNKPNEK